MRAPVISLCLLWAACACGFGAGAPRVESIPLDGAARWYETTVRATPDLARRALGATLSCEPAPPDAGELRYLTDGEIAWGPRLEGAYTFTVTLPHAREAWIETIAVYLPDPGDLLEVTVARVEAAGRIQQVAAARSQ